MNGSRSSCDQPRWDDRADARRPKGGGGVAAKCVTCIMQSDGLPKSHPPSRPSRRPTGTRRPRVRVAPRGASQKGNCATLFGRSPGAPGIGIAAALLVTCRRISNCVSRRRGDRERSKLEAGYGRSGRSGEKVSAGPRCKDRRSVWFSTAAVSGTASAAYTGRPMSVPRRESYREKAIALGLLASRHLRIGAYSRAIETCKTARRLALENGDLRDAAAALAFAARAARLSGDLRQARLFARRAIHEDPSTGLYELATIEEEVGRAHAQRGESTLARAAYSRAARRFEELARASRSRERRQLWTKSAQEARRKRTGVVPPARGQRKT